MNTEIIVRKELVEKIEALQYEVESRKDILSHMIANGMNTTSDKFVKYHDEYQAFFMNYNKAKQEMMKEYGVPNNVNWNLDFATRILTIGDVGGCVCSK